MVETDQPGAEVTSGAQGGSNSTFDRLARGT
jgi:hypothetical protein